MKMRLVSAILIGCILTSPAGAGDKHWKDRCRPVGTWIVEITFPDTNFTFTQLLTLHADRTLEETNNGLHANSFPDPNAMAPPPPAPPAINGSDGQGTWKRLSGCRIKFSFLKFVYAGAETPADPPDVPFPTPAGAPTGFFKVSGIARVRGDTYSSDAESTSSQLLFGPDPKSPLRVIDFGSSVSVGHRLLATD